MITRKNHRYRHLTRSQTHDVWELGDLEEITEEMEKTMKSMGLSSEEIDKAIPKKKENKNGT